MPLRHPPPLARPRLLAAALLALAVLGGPPRPAPPAAADEPAVDPDLARELESEMQSDRDAEQALWEKVSAEWRRLSEDHTPKRLACLQSEAEISRLQGDLIPYRQLTREDFRASHMGKVHLVVEVPGGHVAAHVGLTFLCIGQPRTEELAPGNVVAEMDGLQYVVLLDRDESWWNPQPTPTPERWILRHEQGHFDLAELYARRLDRGAADDMARIRGQGATVAGAISDFAVRWAQHLATARKEFEDLEDQYDRETAHGTIPKAQTRWFERIQRELASTRADTR
jgi:hypothetical protein